MITVANAGELQNVTPKGIVVRSEDTQITWAFEYLPRLPLCYLKLE